MIHTTISLPEWAEEVGQTAVFLSDRELADIVWALNEMGIDDLADRIMRQHVKRVAVMLDPCGGYPFRPLPTRSRYHTRSPA